MSGCEAKVPALRFKGYPAGNAEKAEGGRLPSNTGGRARTPVALWKRNRFGEIATRKSTMGNAVALPRVEYEDVIPFSGFFNNDIFAKPSDKIGVQFSEGDVLFGKLRPYLGNWILAEFKGLAVGDWWVLRPKGIDSEFLYTLIQSPSFQDVANQSSGSKMPRADWSLVSETFFSCPNDPVEQRRIGSLFRSLDALIAGREKSLDKLEALKKSMLLKMFPQGDATVPEVRFKGFAGDWEKKRLGDIGFPYNGLSGKCKDDFGHGKGRYVTYMNVFSNPIAKTDQCDAIEIDKSQNEVKNGDVFFTTSSETPEEVGMSSVWMGDAPNVYLNSFCFGYRPKPGNVSEFLAYLLRANGFRKAMTFLAQGISRYNISKTRVMDLTILLPDKFEQQKIGAYFRSLDVLLAARREEIGKLKQMKKALLERMFV